MGRALTARERFDRSVPERDVQDAILRTARATGWRVMRVSDSRRPTRRGEQLVLVGDALCAGWPDLVLAREPRLIAIECKTETGRLSQAQREWLDVLSACGVETHVARPSNLDEVLATLGSRARQTG